MDGFRPAGQPRPAKQSPPARSDKIPEPGKGSDDKQVRAAEIILFFYLLLDYRRYDEGGQSGVRFSMKHQRQPRQPFRSLASDCPLSGFVVYRKSENG